MKVELSTWTVECPCTNKKLRKGEENIELIDPENFIKREEKFGDLYYAKHGPIFNESYFSENKKNQEGRIFSSPIKINLEPTGRCNLKCRHCYNEDFENELDVKTIEELTQELKTMKVIGVQLLGGEPFLHPNIEKIVKLIKKSELKLEIVTNGFYIDNHLIEYTANFVDGLFVSIDGDRSFHDYLRGRKGSFDSAIYTLRKFSSFGVYTGTVMTVNKLNYYYIKDVCKLTFDNGGKEITVKPMLPVGSGSCMTDFYIPKRQRHEVAFMLNELKKKYRINAISFYFGEEGEYTFFGCPGGSFDITISSNGDVFRCLYDKDPIKSLGNIYRQKFKEVWKKIQNSYPCDISCSFNNRCGGFCQLSFNTQ